MLFLLYALLLVSPEEEVTGLYGEPDIYSTTLQEYKALGANNFEMKMLTNVYIDSLESELDRLADSLAVEFAGCPELLSALESSHPLFLQESRAWAHLAEERIWWDTSEGVRYDGTFRGYTFASALGIRYWHRICQYTLMLRYEASLEGRPAGTSESIGGYMP